jgi:hypothetical protein
MPLSSKKASHTDLSFANHPSDIRLQESGRKSTSLCVCVCVCESKVQEPQTMGSCEALLHRLAVHGREDGPRDD